jgi:hypothetical protein
VRTGRTPGTPPLGHGVNRLIAQSGARGLEVVGGHLHLGPPTTHSTHPREIDSALLSPTVMSEDDPTPSPASKAFAARLAKYAYNPASSSSSRSGSGRASPTVRAVTGPTVHLPASPGASSSRSVPSAMRTPRSRRAKRPVPVDDEDEYDESQLPSDEGPSRRKMVSTKKGQGKKPRSFAGPEVYAHLRPVPDLLGQDLDIVFCGINPGLCSPHSAQLVWGLGAG